MTYATERSPEPRPARPTLEAVARAPASAGARFPGW